MIVSLLCFAAGYGMGGSWAGFGAVAVVFAGWLLGRKYPASGLPHLCLIVSVGIAAAGILIGLSYGLMIAGAIFALAAWDTLYLNASLDSISSGVKTRRYELTHLRSLALVLGLSVLVAVLGGFVSIKLPFFILVLGVGLVIYLLDQVWEFFRRKEKP